VLFCNVRLAVENPAAVVFSDVGGDQNVGKIFIVEMNVLAVDFTASRNIFFFAILSPEAIHTFAELLSASCHVWDSTIFAFYSARKC